MARQSQDVVVRFIGDTGNLSKGMDGLKSRFVGVASSLQGIATVGAAVGAMSFFKSAIDEAREAERVMRQTEQVIRSTGGAAQVTADHVAELSGRMSDLAGVDDEVIQHGANVLLTFKKIRNEVGDGNDIFDQATQASLDMSAAMSKTGDAGEGLQETAIRIGKALNDPIKGMTALSKVGVTFTAEQKEQVKALVEQGDVLSAQKIILAELKTEFGGMAAATADATAKAQVGLANFAETVGLRLMPAVNGFSDWANHTGIPAMTGVADTALDVAIPAVKALAAGVSEVVQFVGGLPGPVLAATAALVVWKLAGDNVTGMFGRMGGSMKTFREQMEVQAALGAMSGESVGKIGAALATLETRVPVLGQMSAAFQKARGDSEGFAGALRGSVAGAFTGFKVAATGLVSFLGGPWGIAIAAATLGLAFFIKKNQDAAQRQRELREAGKAVAEVITQQNGALNENTRIAAANAAEGKGLLKLAKDLGIEGGEVVDAIEKQGAAYDNLIAKLQGKVKVDQEQKGDMEALQGSAFKLVGGLSQIVKGEDEHFAAQNRVRSSVNQTTDAQKTLNQAQDENVTSTDLLKEAVEGLGGKFDETKTDGQHLVDVIKALTDAQTTAIDLEESYEAALDGLTESIQSNGRTLDIHTEKGRNNRDALENAASAIRDMTLADIESGVPAQEAIARHDARVASLQKEAEKAGLNRAETEKLIGTYSRIPPEARTVVTLQNAEAAYQKLLEMNLAQRALAEGISIRAAKGLYGNEAHGGKAMGGPIFGPGGPTSDQVPIWASNGEYMQRASAVDYYGLSVMDAMNNRRIPRDVFRPQFASGGYVNWPFPVNAAKTKIPAFGSDIKIPAGVGGAGVQQWAGLVLSVLAMLGQSTALLPNVLRRMNQESGGNPHAINLWDINAQRGDPSRGLMQTIGSTFNAYAGPFRSRGIYDPLANIYAGLNYAIHRYGNLRYAMDKPGGYKDGGWLMPGQLAYNETTQPEAVFNKKQLASMGTSVNVHFHGPVGSQRELENWLVRSLDNIERKGRR